MLEQGRFRIRFAEGQTDVQACQALRHLCFVEAAGRPAEPDGRDVDELDAICRHAMVEEVATDRLVSCFRLLPFGSGAEIGKSYSAKFYDLSPLSGFEGPMVEMGRFCIHPEARDASALRLAWGLIARYIDETGAEMIFGCSSFRGTDARAYIDAFAHLSARHVGPAHWRPRIKADEVVRFADLSAHPDERRAMLVMPPLLRFYLGLGGWVSDHAVIHREMDTLHVFTWLEVARIPPVRARTLRAIAG